MDPLVLDHHHQTLRLHPNHIVDLDSVAAAHVAEGTGTVDEVVFFTRTDLIVSEVGLRKDAGEAPVIGMNAITTDFWIRTCGLAII